MATAVITGGGILIIFTVVVILVLILRVAIPLFRSPTAERLAVEPLATPGGAPVLSTGLDDAFETGMALDAVGVFTFFRLPDGNVVDLYQAEAPGAGASSVLAVEAWGDHRYSLVWNNGAVSVYRVRYVSEFEGEERTIVPRVSHLADVSGPAPQPGDIVLVRADDEGNATRIDLPAAGGAGTVRLVRTKENLFGEKTVEENELQLEGGIPGPLKAAALSEDGRRLFAASGTDQLRHWEITASEAVVRDSLKAFRDGRSITALGFVFGDVSIAVGDDRGEVTTWFTVSNEATGERNLRRIHAIAGHNAPITGITESRRNKSLVTTDASGSVHLLHMTSERDLLEIVPAGIAGAAQLSNRSNGLVAVDENGRLVFWKVDNPHPETSWKTLFGKVWYEKYPAPDYTWQSSAPSDDFEPKFSMIPLLFGSFKGTFYAMLIAVPLAILGAVYTSQFTTPWFRGKIKPVVEIMAAIPSVVIGFIIALWFAPIVEEYLVSFAASLILIPVFVAVFLALWLPFTRSSFARRVERGYEFVVIAPILVAAVYVSKWAGPHIEEWVFNGDVKQWLFGNYEIQYDQRNAMIIAFGLGFAVIPIIFTIAEDAISNVPPSLKAASLALGASRWQTLWRVTLPSASPGIFAGMVIGFGRAIGETMIVLMATGNTPIIDWSPFNGMRTLSANIAVEIPEAPVDGTLYRVLFLSAVLLFLLTSVLNTIAEVARQSLRKKYGQFQ